MNTWELVSGGVTLNKSATHIFQQRQQRHGPDDGTQATDYVLIGGDISAGRPQAIERVERGGSDIRVDDTWWWGAGGVKQAIMCMKPNIPRVWKASVNSAPLWLANVMSLP